MMIAWFILIYLLTGIIFLLCYILVFRPESKDAQLGLVVLLWPVILFMDAVLAISSQMGVVVRTLSVRFKK